MRKKLIDAVSVVVSAVAVVSFVALTIALMSMKKVRDFRFIHPTFGNIETTEVWPSAKAGDCALIVYNKHAKDWRQISVEETPKRGDCEPIFVELLEEYVPR